MICIYRSLLKSEKANVGGGILLVLLGGPPLLVLGVLFEVGLDGPDGRCQLLGHLGRISTETDDMLDHRSGLDISNRQLEMSRKMWTLITE